MKKKRRKKIYMEVKTEAKRNLSLEGKFVIFGKIDIFVKELRKQKRI